MSTNETRTCFFLLGVGIAITLPAMMSMPPFGRVGVFILVLAVALVIAVMFAQSYVQDKAIRQDDADEYRKMTLMFGRGGARSAQVVEPSPVYWQQPPQLAQGQPQPVQPIEQDLNIGGG